MLLLIALVAASLCSTVTWFIRLLLRHRQYSHIPGPPVTNYIIGNAKQLRAGLVKHGNMGDVMLELMKENGDLLLVWRGTSPMVILGHLPAIREYFTNLKIFRKPKVGIFKLNKIGGTSFLGNHSILSDPGGPNWEHKKRVMDPGFRVATLQGHIPKFYQLGEQVAAELMVEQMSEGVVEFGRLITPYTIRAISSAGFGVRDEATLESLCIGNMALADFWKKQIEETNPLKKTAIARILRLNGTWEAEKDLKEIRGMGERLILSRVEDPEFTGTKDALDMIILANECGGGINMEKCVDEFVTLYEAGNITTARTMSFFLAEVVRHPDIQDALIREVDEIWVGRGISGNSPVEEIVQALKDMVYLDATLCETLRHRGPVSGGMREIQQDLEVLGYKLPAKTHVMVSQQAIHHHPKYWENPETFDPTRFLDKKKIVPFTYLPFIAGPRKCLGKNFALLEMKVFLSIWFSRFRFEKHPDSDDEVKVEQALLIRLVDSRVVVKMRK